MPMSDAEVFRIARFLSNRRTNDGPETANASETNENSSVLVPPSPLTPFNNLSNLLQTVRHRLLPDFVPIPPRNPTTGIHQDARFALMAEEMRKTFWWIGIEAYPLPSREVTREALDYFAGATGIDVNGNHNVTFNAGQIRDYCDVDVRSILAMGMTTPIDVDNVHDVLKLAVEIETGTHTPRFNFRDIDNNDVAPFAASYKHGKHTKLTRERLSKGLLALQRFVRPGKKVSIWIDSIFRQNERKVRMYNPNMRYKSWASHGLLPYHIFPVLCLGNKASEREENEWVDSFWLNIEGTMGCLGSGLIFSDPDCEESPVCSWYVNSPMMEHNFVVVDPQPFTYAAYKRGSYVSTTNALQHVLKIAAEGGFADKIVTFQEDKDKLEEMAEYILYATGWQEAGLVLYANYNAAFAKSILEREVTKPTRNNFLSAIQRTSFSFKDVSFDGILHEVKVETGCNKHGWRGEDEWLPSISNYFRTTPNAIQVTDMWVNVKTETGDDAAVGLCFTGRDRPFDYVKVKVVDLLSDGDTNRSRVRTHYVVWNVKVPGLLFCVVKAIETQEMSYIEEIAAFIRGVGVSLGPVTGAIFSQCHENDWY